jgi:hypothetical protein
MGSSSVAPTPAQLIEQLQVHELRPQDFGRLVELVTRSQISYLCVAAGHLRRAGIANGVDWTQGTIVATDPEGVAGFALIERGRDARTGQLTVAIDPRSARGPAPGRLVQEAVALARRLGLDRLETQVSRKTSLTLFQEAGLRTLSSMCMGGVTDVALAVA